MPEINFDHIGKTYTEQEMRDWFLDTAQKLAALVSDKRLAYGDNLVLSAQFVHIMFPDGVPPEAYEDLLVMLRMFDKFMRLANKHKNPDGWVEQETPWVDLAGYSLAHLMDLVRFDNL